MFTLGKAAIETGKSKTTIANAINKGRLSANIDDKGQYQIDPSELFRVYPPSPSIRRSNEKTETVQSTNGIERELELIKEQLEREREINKRLFDALDDAHKERRQLTLMLEHLQEPKQKIKTNANELWNRIFRGKV